MISQMAIQRDWEQLESYIKRNTVMMQKTHIQNYIVIIL